MTNKTDRLNFLDMLDFERVKVERSQPKQKAVIPALRMAESGGRSIDDIKEGKNEVTKGN